MKLLRRLLVKLLRPVLHVLGGRLRQRKRLDYKAYEQVRGVVQIGDVIVTRRRGLVAWLIPGYWSHAAIVTGSELVTHAVYPVVESTPLANLVMTNDDVAVLRPRFAAPVQRQEAAAFARRFVGVPYDLGFGPGKDAFYCSELVWHAYQSVVPSWGFEPRERLGVDTVTPEDLFAADKHFEFIDRAGS
jgi:uncharacterized protein YycO